MNVYNLVRKLTFLNNCILYTPEDPFRIYERLAKLFLNTLAGSDNKPTHWNKNIILLSNIKIEPKNILNEYEWREYGYNPGYRTPLRFLKWVLQEIPDCFWKFNIYIDSNRYTLKQSINNSKQNEIWIDMKGIKNKMKCVEISNNVLQDLKNKVTYLPTYAQIAKELPTWGKYKYKYGNIKDLKVSWIGGE